MNLWLYAFIALSIVGSLFAFIAGRYTTKDPKQGYKNLFKPLLLFLVGTIFSITAGELNSHQSQAVLKKDLKALKTELGGKNDKIEELNKFILSSITGGDSYCFFQVGSLSPDNSTGLLVLNHKGQYPIHDIQVRIADMQKLKPITPDTTFESLMQTQTILNVGTLYPNVVKVLKRVNFHGKKDLRWQIFFSASNGHTAQILLMKLVNGHWLTATQVTRYPTDKPLYEQIDRDFPREPNGSIKW